MRENLKKIRTKTAENLKKDSHQIVDNRIRPSPNPRKTAQDWKTLTISVDDRKTICPSRNPWITARLYHNILMRSAENHKKILAKFAEKLERLSQIRGKPCSKTLTKSQRRTIKYPHENRWKKTVQGPQSGQITIIIRPQ